MILVMIEKARELCVSFLQGVHGERHSHQLFDSEPDTYCC